MSSQQQPHDPHIKELTPSLAKEKFAETLHDITLKEKEQQTAASAASLGLPYISLVGVPIPPGPLGVVPEEDAKQFQIVCFAENSAEKRIALVNPYVEGLQQYLEGIEHKTHAQVSIYLMSQASFESVAKLYSQLPRVTPESEGVQITESDLQKFGESFSDIRALQEKISGVTTSEVITLFIAVALKSRASDIHVEAEQDGVKVRLRIDGVLHDAALLPLSDWAHMISRIKLLSGLKLNVSDRPQDGRFTIFLKDDEVDVRVSALPTKFGESVVMRILRSSAAGLKFDDLGLSQYASRQLLREIKKPNGMIITTGPTGSGKTTTMYAILNYLNSPELKIITLEDPVEYKLLGINQSQIDAAQGYTFASGLRSILRQDPDIVMVGEIRDLETADIAINAALTGHLVLSTIHTNSAAGALPRFLAMGVKSFLLAPSLNAVMGQRLVRRLCQHCKVETALDAETLPRVQEALSTIPPASGVTLDVNNLHFFSAPGCDTCHGIGYQGRIGIYEIMGMCPEIEQQILSSTISEYTVQDIAKKNGMLTMLQDGLLRALEGVTSVEEVLSVAA